MAAIMRLRRMGRRNRPCFRVVVADSRHPRDGRFIESLGHYDPLQDPAEVEIDESKVMKWLGEGVELSDTVRSILKREGLLRKWHDSKLVGAGSATNATAEDVGTSTPAEKEVESDKE